MNNTRWTLEQVNFLKENYNTLNLEELSKKLEKTISAIVSKASKFKLSIDRRKISKFNSKYTINQDYFSIIDTENKAYFLGLLYADGWNTRKGFGISLQEKDKEILEKFIKDLEYTGKLYKIDFHIKNGNQIQYSIRVQNKKISEDLSNLGCVPKKSLILKFPTNKQVPDYLLNHFIRGYFDGDGYISKNGNCLNIVSSYEFIKQLQLILIEKCNLNITKLISCGKAFALQYGGKKQLNRIKLFIYKDSNTYLDRKYIRFFKP